MKKRISLLIIALVIIAGKVECALPDGHFTGNGPFCGSGTGTLTWHTTADGGNEPFTITYNDGVQDHTVSGINDLDIVNVGTVTSTTTYSVTKIVDSRTPGGHQTNNSPTGSDATITIYTLPIPTITGLTDVCLGATGVTYTT